MPGLVTAIRIAPEHEQLPEPVDSIDVTDEGLPGDRYFGRGDITLVEAEALENPFEFSLAGTHGRSGLCRAHLDGRGLRGLVLPTAPLRQMR